jgi:predicted transposase YdaD
MCNLSEGVWSDGRKVGRKEGRKEGQQEEAQKIAVNLAKLNIPIEKIAEATQKSIFVVKKWIELDSSKTSGGFTKA